MPVPFALEVIQRTLRSHSTLFLHDPPFQYILRERTTPLVLRTMQRSQQEWAVSLRLCHLTCTLLTVYSSKLRTESEILLAMLSKDLLNEAAPIWQRALALETFRVVLQAVTTQTGQSTSSPAPSLSPLTLTLTPAHIPPPSP